MKCGKQENDTGGKVGSQSANTGVVSLKNLAV